MYYKISFSGFGETPRIMEAMINVVDARNGVQMLHGDPVEGSASHTQAEGSILILSTEDDGGTWGRASRCETLTHILLEDLNRLIFLITSRPLHTTIRRFFSRHKIDDRVNHALKTKATIIL